MNSFSPWSMNVNEAVRRVLISFNLLLAVAFVGCSSTVKYSRLASMPSIRGQVLLAPYANATDDDHAARALTEITSAALSREGLYIVPGKPDLTTQRIDKAATLHEAREQNIDHVVFGTVMEFRYKTDLDGDPAVGISIEIVDSHTGRSLWRGSASNVGIGFSSLTSTAQEVVEDLVEKIPILYPGEKARPAKIGREETFQAPRSKQTSTPDPSREYEETPSPPAISSTTPPPSIVPIPMRENETPLALAEPPLAQILPISPEPAALASASSKPETEQTESERAQAEQIQSNLKKLYESPLSSEAFTEEALPRELVPVEPRTPPWPEPPPSVLPDSPAAPQARLERGENISHPSSEKTLSQETDLHPSHPPVAEGPPPIENAYFASFLPPPPRTNTFHQGRKSNAREVKRKRASSPASCVLGSLRHAIGSKKTSRRY